MESKPRCVFVTVGSTKFDDLARVVLSSEGLDSLSTRNFNRLVFQCGNSALDGLVPGSLNTNEWNWKDDKSGINISVWRFQPELNEYFRQADLVISHAGSGTILEVLRFPRLMIVVPNETLLDNHQVELAKALEELGHLFSSTPKNLAKTIRAYDPVRIQEFPQFDGSKFRTIMDEEMEAA